MNTAPTKPLEKGFTFNKEEFIDLDGYDSAQIDDMTIQFAKSLVGFLNTSVGSTQ